VTAAVAVRGAIAPSAAPIAERLAMREALDAALDVAPTPTTALLLGESGTGKEIVARCLHAQSQRQGSGVQVKPAGGADGQEQPGAQAHDEGIRQSWARRDWARSSQEEGS
jgi:transcriptional regulator of acetoin/glycerol metabolism